MLLQDLSKNKTLIMQIIWGEKVIEFPTKLVESDAGGIYVTPYLREGHPLELNLDPSGNVVCHLYGDHVDTGKRLSWRNIKLETVKKGENTFYYLTTMGFNKLGKEAERRAHERSMIRQMGSVTDTAGNSIQVMVHDMSDNGISFYAPSNFSPASKNLVIEFADSVGTEIFRIRVECRVVYSADKAGTVFYGCELVSANGDYFLYGCMKKAIKNNKMPETKIDTDMKAEE